MGHERAQGWVGALRTKSQLRHRRALLNLNPASTQSLKALPGIGPSKAATIMADRDSNGPFTSIGNLKRQWDRAGDYGKLRDLVTVK